MPASPVSVANEQNFWTIWKRVIWIAICSVTTASRFVLSADTGAESNQTSAGLDFPVNNTDPQCFRSKIQSILCSNVRYQKVTNAFEWKSPYTLPTMHCSISLSGAKQRWASVQSIGYRFKSIHWHHIICTSMLLNCRLGDGCDFLFLSSVAEGFHATTSRFSPPASKLHTCSYWIFHKGLFHCDSSNLRPLSTVMSYLPRMSAHFQHISLNATTYTYPAAQTERYVLSMLHVLYWFKCNKSICTFKLFIWVTSFLWVSACPCVQSCHVQNRLLFAPMMGDDNTGAFSDNLCILSGSAQKCPERFLTTCCSLLFHSLVETAGKCEAKQQKNNFVLHLFLCSAVA